MTVDERSAITREIRVAARPETVFAFLTDPAKMVRWMGGRVELDPRSGGVYRVEINTRDIARGEYVEVVPHRRVVFTWGWEGGGPVRAGSTTVEITLDPDGDRPSCAWSTAISPRRRVTFTRGDGSTTWGGWQ